MSKLTKKTKLVGIAVLVIGGIAVAVLAMGKNAKQQEIYREDVVKRGNLTVGITESSFAELGIVEQSFEEDLSFLWETEAEYAKELIVEEICVSEGQTVHAKDALCRLKADGVEKLYQKLKNDLTDAQASLETMHMQQDSAQQNAKYIYDSSIAYGIYAEEEYNSTVRTLEAAVTEVTEALADAKSTLSIYQEQLRIVASDYTKAGNVLKECEKSRDKTDRTKNTSQYIEYFNLAVEAQDNLDALAQKKAQLEKNVEETSQRIEMLTAQLEQAQRDLKLERLNAQETMELRKLAYNTAGETYDVTTKYWEQNVLTSERAYDEATEKWEKFNAYFDQNVLMVQAAGVIGQLSLTKGEVLDGRKNPVALYDVGEVTLCASVAEAEAQELVTGALAEVVFAAYPDKPYRGGVTELAEPQEMQVSGGDVQQKRKVTVTLQGDVSGLLQGMTGQITFIQREEQGVLFVSNRAIKREGYQAYVTVKGADGSFTEKEVVTGFSDGTNVEIAEGLSEGDVVCYTLREQQKKIPSKKPESISLAEGEGLVCARVTCVRGNEITYLLISASGAEVSAGDASVAAMDGEGITTQIPVGVLSDVSELAAGDELLLVTKETEAGTVITAVYRLA